MIKIKSNSIHFMSLTLNQDERERERDREREKKEGETYVSREILISLYENK